MELVTGALPSVLTKLGDLLVGEYNLQKGVKGEIRFLQSELESMKGALEKLSDTPADKLDIQDKTWAKELRELSYDIEDSIDTFMVRFEGNESPNLHGIKKFVGRSVGLFRKGKIRHGIATEISEIKRRVVEVHERRQRYEVNHGVGKNASASRSVDPRLFAQFTNLKELVGMDERRDELIKILMEENNEGKIVSIVGFGGLGKTTLANAVYVKIRAQFDCCAFVSVSQAPALNKLLKVLLYQLDNEKYGKIDERSWDELQLLNELREFLQHKRYFIVIDDIWEISVWRLIRCGLPDNDVGYKIIATTRILDLAEKVGNAYRLKPLSLSNSQKLLNRRVFGHENTDINEGTEKCPDKELAEASYRILKKCAGVPLAIITVASLLASKGRNKMEWYEVCNSIGTGLENSLDVENMRKILSFSYYDLPCHLRTCLLYLCIFPEDYKIEKDRLIWMWIAEGFIQCEKQGRSLFELGESYFDDLIQRSMIQPIYDVYGYMIYECRVHDMVLDLIRHLSREENFVTIITSLDHGSPLYSIRRLSLQDGNEEHDLTSGRMTLQQVRSVIVFPSSISQVPVLASFRVLRVLDLQDYDLSQGYNFKYLGNLYHLRYLGLRGTNIHHVPEGIENIRFLQTLDVRNNPICDLSLTVVQLKHLMCLCFDGFARVPKGFGSLTSLKHLFYLMIEDSTVYILEELGQLTELRVLRIIFFMKWIGNLVACLTKLQKIQHLYIEVTNVKRSMGGLDAWAAPDRHLRSLDTKKSCWFSKLPAWMNPSLLPDLSFVSIAVMELCSADLEILGRFPALRYLDVLVDHDDDLGNLGGFAIGSGSFPCLVYLGCERFVRPVVFQQGAMPRLRTLRYEFSASGHAGIDLGLGNLPSLQEIFVRLDSEGASDEEVKGLKASLRHATKIHPNHPCLEINDISQVQDDE